MQERRRRQFARLPGEPAWKSLEQRLCERAVRPGSSIVPGSPEHSWTAACRNFLALVGWKGRIMRLRRRICFFRANTLWRQQAAGWLFPNPDVRFVGGLN
jgi:hypothetical protein